MESSKIFDPKSLSILLSTDPYLRKPSDIDSIFKYFRPSQIFASFEDSLLRQICKLSRFVHHQANDIIFCRGELADSWFILISGSVFIDGYNLLPPSSFGRRSSNMLKRTTECVAIEPSSLLIIDYATNNNANNNTNGSNFIQNQSFSGYHDNFFNKNPFLKNKLSSMCSSKESSFLKSLQNLDFTYVGSNMASHSSNESKYCSDDSSAYSGSDAHPPSLSGLMEGFADSDEDEEDLLNSNTETDEGLSMQDTVRDCFEKIPSQRSEEDINILMNFVKHLGAFASLLESTRRSICEIMIFVEIEKSDTVVINNNEKLDCWSVIINGSVEIMKDENVDDGDLEIAFDSQQNISSIFLTIGDCFGVSPSNETQYFSGEMITRSPDCQFLCVKQEDYAKLMSQGQKSMLEHKSPCGDVVMVTEQRISSDLLSHQSEEEAPYVVIRGSLPQLIDQLWADHHTNSTYIEDFLLTFRVYSDSPLEIANKLLVKFNENASFRSKITRVILLWVNNHFSDFENNPEMMNFLEKFENFLEVHKMVGQSRLLNIACSAKSKTREIVLTRSKRDEMLNFSILGGCSKGIYVAKVEPNSKAFVAGLKRGDQIISVNAHSFHYISHSKSLDILRSSTHLSILVKYNLLGFKDLIAYNQDDKNEILESEEVFLKHKHFGSLCNSCINEDYISSRSSSAFGNYKTIISCNITKNPKALHDKTDSTSSGINSLSKNDRSFKMGLLKAFGDKMGNLSKHISTGFSQKTSSSRIHQSLKKQHSNNFIKPLSRSNPDLAAAHSSSTLPTLPDSAIKVYRVSSSSPESQFFKYILINQETTVKEAILLAHKEFNMTDSSEDYCLCEVSVGIGGIIKQRRLPDQINHLVDKLGLNARYYLKNNMCQENLINDDIMNELCKESQVNLLQLKSFELARQLSLRDFDTFRQIEPTDYINYLFNMKLLKSANNFLKSFEQITNNEMFWPVTEICKESNCVKRAKLIKFFIKTAKHCLDLKNFNTSFAIICGLGHKSIVRLSQSWDKVSIRHEKMFQEIENLMDPTRNMSKYRGILSKAQPPIIPFFPLVIKDLTFIHLGNQTKTSSLTSICNENIENVLPSLPEDAQLEQPNCSSSLVNCAEEGVKIPIVSNKKCDLINFEKMRLLSREIRSIYDMCSAPYTFKNTLDTCGAYSMSANASMMNNWSLGTQSFATIRKHLNPTSNTFKISSSDMPCLNAKRLYEDAQMTRKIKAYLSEFKSINDEEVLWKMSLDCEPANNLTQGYNNTSKISLTASNENNSHKPIFGANSPQSAQKLLSLSEPGKKRQTLNPGTSCTRHPQQQQQTHPKAYSHKPSVKLLKGHHNRSNSDSPLSLYFPIPAVNLCEESSSVTTLSKYNPESSTSNEDNRASVSNSSSSFGVLIRKHQRKCNPPICRETQLNGCGDSGRGSLTNTSLAESSSNSSLVQPPFVDSPLNRSQILSNLDIVAPKPPPPIPSRRPVISSNFLPPESSSHHSNTNSHYNKDSLRNDKDDSKDSEDDPKISAV